MNTTREAEQSRARRVAAKQPLLDRLSDAVPRAAVESDRRILLRLRRDVFNERTPRHTDLEVGSRYLDGPELAWWLGERAREEATRDRARTQFDDGLTQARRTLAAIAVAPHFAGGVLLSGRYLSDQARRYHAQVADTGELPPGLHKVENSLVSLAFRSALKPSPYGGFTVVGLTPWERPRTSGETVDGAYSIACLDRGLTDWLIAALTTARAGVPACDLRLNNTVRVHDDRVEFVVPSSSWSPEAGELLGQFRELAVDGSARVVLDWLAVGSEPEAVLLERLERAGVGSAASRQVIEDLVAEGVCERGVAVPDQELGYLRAAAERMAKLGEDAGARILGALSDLEQEFGQAGSTRRAEILAEIETQIGAVQDGARPPARTTVFEDVGSRSGPRNWDGALLVDSLDDFEALHRLLPVFDTTLVARRALYRLFMDRYGPAEEPVGFLDFYRHFVESAVGSPRRLLDGQGVPDVVAIQRLRFRFAAYLKQRLRAGPEGHEVELGPDWIREFLGELPDCVRPWDSATHLLQISDRREGGPALVLNEVRSGNGAFLARFSRLGGRTETLRELIAARNPRQCDVTAVFGRNYNLHPRLAPLTLAYPGAQSEEDGALSLRDLRVRADVDRQELELVSHLDRSRLDLVPMNLMQPAASPHLYQFLYVFAQSANHRGGLWDLYLANRSRPSDSVSVPRLTLGNIVLERRTWYFPVSVVRAALDTDGDELQALLAVDDWREAQGLPAECFFRLQPKTAARRTSGADIFGGLYDPSARQAARAHKPHYLDFSHRFLVRALRGVLESAPPNAQVVFQECLPGTDTYSAGSGCESAEELAVEVHLT